MKKNAGLFCALALLFSGVVPTMTSCKSVDYVSKTHLDLAENVWKSGAFSDHGFGVVTLKTGIDGDTAHFYDKKNQLIKGRFNGVDTPESTGTVEAWGAKAKKYTTDLLESAKTIVLERDRGAYNGDFNVIYNELGPEVDGTGRHLVWVWVSERPVDEEDGSQLKLVNLGLVQEGYSAVKSISGTYYEDVFMKADAQAQKKKLHIWDPKGDPDYDGSTDGGVVSLKVLYSMLDDDKDTVLEHKFYVEGIVTRVVNKQCDCYIEQYVYDANGNLTERYGMFVFSMYNANASKFFKVGRKIGFAAMVSERYGGYQMHDISFGLSTSSTDYTRDVHFVDSKRYDLEDPIVKTGSQFATEDKNINYNCLIKISDVTVTGGYGGTAEKNSSGENYSTNAMTLYCRDASGEFTARIDSNVVIHYFDDEHKTVQIKSYKVFVNECNNGATFDFIGLKGVYQADEETSSKLQLMLVGDADIVIHRAA